MGTWLFWCDEKYNAFGDSYIETFASVEEVEKYVERQLADDFVVIHVIKVLK